MLLELQIRNFAIVEEETISFQPGLNVISGETGSGKSIILQALQLVLGGRGSSEAVRKGSEELEVRALFSLEHCPAELRTELPEDFGEGDELIIARSLTKTGKSKVRINGAITSIGQLSELTTKLVTICGQHQTTRLLDLSYQLRLLDDYAGNQGLISEYQQEFATWSKLSADLKRKRKDRELEEKRLAELESHIEDLSGLELKPSLRSEIEDRIKALSNVENIAKSVDLIAALLNEEERGVFQQITRVRQELLQLSKWSERGQEFLGLCDSVNDALGEIEIGLHSLSGSLEHNPEELDLLRDNLSTLSKMQRKFKCEAEDLEGLLKSFVEERAALEEGLDLEKLEAELLRLEQSLRVKAQDLRQKRVKAAKSFVEAVKSELADLGMLHADLEIAFKEIGLSRSGMDAVEILIATNRGEPKYSMGKIASGGELARITLVLKKVLREKHFVNVMVFDEVDSGISGKIARAVGKKLKAIAGDSQVLCITHLPQVASLADNHILVTKVDENERTVSRAVVLDEEGRVDEVARMLAGMKVTELSRESARELLASKT